MTTRPATPPKATSVIGDKEWNRRANSYPRLVKFLNGIDPGHRRRQIAKKAAVSRWGKRK